MDWQTFLQWFFIVASGGSIFGAWLAWASRKNGRETRRYLGELISKMSEIAEQRHQEVVEWFKKSDEWFKKSDEWFKKSDERFIKSDERFIKSEERAEIRHQEVTELLKTGFGDTAELLKKGFGTLIQQRAT